MSKKSRGLFDYEYQLELINKHQPPLAKLSTVPFDRLMMFKILILQRYYYLIEH